MGYNKSLDFLNMIRNGEEPKPARKNQAASLIAVIDTETNWHDEVMSLGVAIPDKSTFKCVDTRYYIFDPEVRIGGMYSGVLYKCANKAITTTRAGALENLIRHLKSGRISDIYAYNARFDFSHLPELREFNWYDIMRIAAYRQFNRSIPATAPCCKTGRLKSNYGVESITRMLTGNERYCEVHNAVADAVDELRIMELLGQPADIYNCAEI